MSQREFTYRWSWDLVAPPEALWPLIADTNRFNRDTGLPTVARLPVAGVGQRHLSFTKLGVTVEWDEEPFEWVHPQRFGVLRRYRRGPIAQMRVLATLTPRPQGGTKLLYEVWAQPRGVLGLAAIPIQIGWISRRSFSEIFQRYDRLASQPAPQLPRFSATFASGGRERLAAAKGELESAGLDKELVGLLGHEVEHAGDLEAARLRPYALAQVWRADRRKVLELCLQATRAGLLDLQWELLCPMCRGTNDTGSSLKEIHSQVHCESCGIDYTVDFDRSVELTFRVNSGIRPVSGSQYGIGGPMVTPHIAVQQSVPAGERRVMAPVLEPGRYRLRAVDSGPGLELEVVPDGPARVQIELVAEGWVVATHQLGTRPSLDVQNSTLTAARFVLERTAWSDLAVTAVEVTALQRFRDLFSSEALRPGEQISVGRVAVLFTDLRGSTNLYRDIGDAPAFGLVMEHFEVLRQTIDQEGGALVKTIGDAVMAVFKRPVGAVRAAILAQERLADPPGGLRPLELRAGVHCGPCIAVTLNDRLDYFGSSVNVAARLEPLSSGKDVVLTAAARNDPEVSELFVGSEAGFSAERFEAVLKNFGEERFELWRVSRK